MSKRVSPSVQGTCAATSKKTKHWSFGLIEAMKDPNSIVKKTERVAVMKDKYPKAKIHYLVLPFESINSIYNLNDTHVSLLEEFGEIYDELRNENDELKAGFHAVPSLQRLHMHVISTDMISRCLKTKVHWNSFNTKFFISYEDLLKELKENGFIEKISNDLHKQLLATELKCNQCNYKPKNMPQLKEHLLIHVL